MAQRSGEMITYEGDGATIQAYLSRPVTQDPLPAVIVIHEIFGLNDHIMDVADRFVKQGYVAFAPHLYSRPELVDALTPQNIETAMRFRFSLPPEKMNDKDYMKLQLEQLPPEQRETIIKVSPLAFGGLPKEKMIQDLLKAVDYLNAQSFVKIGKIGSVGFCFGGGMSLNLACHANLAACVIFYGDNPSPIELVANIPCPVLGLYGGNDMRVNAHLDELVKAMVDYKKDFEMRIFPDAAHAFFNDTHQGVYREAAANEAWQSVLRFYLRTLSSM